MKSCLRRGPVLLVAAGLFGTGVVGFGASARADVPAEQGWWTSANPGSVQGVAAPASPPAPPDVPSNGLLIEGGPTSAKGAADTGATAYAALIYELPAGANVSPLTLSVAPSTATTPSAALELCPLTTQQFQPEAGGPISDAPSYDCTKNVTAAAASSSYQFDVSSLVSNDALAVAILPTSPTDRVVLSQPGDPSLTVQPAATGTIPSPAAAGSSAATETPGGSGSPAATPADTAVTSAAPGGGAVPSPTGTEATAAPSQPIPPASAVTQSPALAPPARSVPTQQLAATPGVAQLASDSPGGGIKPWVGLIFLAGLLAAAGLWMGAGRVRATRPTVKSGEI